MRRAIPFLAAAAALTATGCTSSHCDPSDVNVYWESFTDVNGRTFTCAGSDVVGVQVFVDGQAQLLNSSGQPQPVSCIPFPGQSSAAGVTLLAFTPGTYSIEVQAYDQTGNLKYLAQTSVVVPGNACGQVLTVDTVPTQVADDLTVAYSITGGQACPANSFVWYSLFDVTGNASFSAVDGQHSPQSVPCGSVLTFPTALFGQYQLDFIQIVTPTGNPATPYAAVFQDCTPLAFNHSGRDGTTVPPLQTATVSCQ